jgi:cytochrome c oxidase assembly protein subunit 11
LSEVKKKSNRRLVLGLVGFVAAMFGFGFAMVPLYGLICSVSGINSVGAGGRHIDEAEAAAIGVDRQREVRVEFDATLNTGLDWEVRPETGHLLIHPGKVYEVAYYARNNSDHAITAQAIPGITPWQATQYFNKIACFCFNQQKLAAGESADLKLRFVLSPDLPDKYKTVTLSYTFMNVDRERLRHSVSVR